MIKYLESEVAKPRAQSVSQSDSSLPLSGRARGAAWDQLKSVSLRNYSTIRDECSQIGTTIVAEERRESTLSLWPVRWVGRTFDSIHGVG